MTLTVTLGAGTTGTPATAKYKKGDVVAYSYSAQSGLCQPARHARRCRGRGHGQRDHGQGPHHHHQRHPGGHHAGQLDSGRGQDLPEQRGQRPGHPIHIHCHHSRDQNRSCCAGAATRTTAKRRASCWGRHTPLTPPWRPGFWTTFWFHQPAGSRTRRRNGPSAAVPTNFFRQKKV